MVLIYTILELVIDQINGILLFAELVPGMTYYTHKANILVASFAVNSLRLIIMLGTDFKLFSDLLLL